MSDDQVVPSRRQAPTLHLRDGARAQLASDEERYFLTAAVAESLARSLPEIVAELSCIRQALQRLVDRVEP